MVGMTSVVDQGPAGGPGAVGHNFSPNIYTAILNYYHDAGNFHRLINLRVYAGIPPNIMPDSIFGEYGVVADGSIIAQGHLERITQPVISPIIGNRTLAYEADLSNIEFPSSMPAYAVVLFHSSGRSIVGPALSWNTDARGEIPTSGE